MITIGASDTSKESNSTVYYLGDTLTAGYTVGSLIINSILTLLTGKLLSKPFIMLRLMHIQLGVFGGFTDKSALKDFTQAIALFSPFPD